MSAASPVAHRSALAAKASATAPSRGWFETGVRRLPIRWRILAIAVLNSLLALLLLARLWDGAKVLSEAWDELRQVRQSERLLVLLGSESGRLQSLIHRYFTQPSPEVLADIVHRRDALLSNLRVQAKLDRSLAGSAEQLIQITEAFLAGFEALREVRAAVATTYQADVLRPAREMAGLYAIIDSTVRGSDSLIAPSLGKSREAFNAMLLAANAFYLSNSRTALDEAEHSAEMIERTAPVMLDLAETDLQRTALGSLRLRAHAVGDGLDKLASQLDRQAELLRSAIDDNAAGMQALIGSLGASIAQRERSAQENFDRTLETAKLRSGLVALAFVVIVTLVGIGVAKSIRDPLRDLRGTMLAIVNGDYRAPLRGVDAPDEVGDMARAVEVFRDNAIAKAQAEEALRAAKERAETALAELREAQTSLIEAEKLAALGGLVAGVAHEVNNPVGISLTVASSLARRCDEFAAELQAGPIRRSRLAEFVAGNREAADQLVANLQRAGELVQAFKQVAVDRSHAERRLFDLAESTEQIVSSLRPGLKKSQLRLVIDIPQGITMDSYPGPFGQVLTNLFLNAVLHGFPDGTAGTISLVARASGPDQVQIVFRDNGAGMAEEVQKRAFDPFFTTRRGDGGTGLGLHIVYNLVTRRLGGRITLTSALGVGTTFRIILPLKAPAEEAQPQPAPVPLAEV